MNAPLAPTSAIAIDIIGIRPEVLRFAALMEHTLRKHDAAKGVAGWKSIPMSHLADLLEEKGSDLRSELAILYDTHVVGNPIANQGQLAEEAADVANLSMMLLDVIAALPQDPIHVHLTESLSGNDPIAAILLESEGAALVPCECVGVTEQHMVANSPLRGITEDPQAALALRNEVLRLRLSESASIFLLPGRFNRLRAAVNGFLADWGPDAPKGWAYDELIAAVSENADPESREYDPQLDLVSFLLRQRKFSLATFGPGARAKGVIDHIAKELAEVSCEPGEISEWIDIAILAFDGAMRCTGCTPAQVAQALAAKQALNESREWPNWRTQSPDRAIEHIRKASEVPVSVPRPAMDPLLRSIVARLIGASTSIDASSMLKLMDAIPPDSRNANWEDSRWALEQFHAVLLQEEGSRA